MTKDNSRHARIQKTAKIILAIGKDYGAEILKMLDLEDIRQITAEMIKIGTLPDIEKEAILKDFKKEIHSASSSLEGGVDQAKLYLQKALGEERAQKYYNRLEKLAPDAFKKFESYPAQIIAVALSTENERITSLFLTQVSPAFAAKVIARLDKPYQFKVVKILSSEIKVLPETLKTLHQSLEKKIDQMEKTLPDFIDGEDRLSEILSYMDKESETSLIENISKDDPDVAQRLKEKLRNFHDLMNLSQKEIRLLMERIPEIDIWAKALKGAGANLVTHIISSLSVNRSSDIMEQMNSYKHLSLKEITKKRDFIMTILESMEEENLIIRKRNKEKYV